MGGLLGVPKGLPRIHCFLVQGLLCHDRHLNNPHVLSPHPSRSFKNCHKRQQEREKTHNGTRQTATKQLQSLILVHRNMASVELTKLLRTEGFSNSFCPHGRAALCVNSHSNGNSISYLPFGTPFFKVSDTVHERGYTFLKCMVSFI